MAHGYLGDGYGLHGDFDEDRERDWRERAEHWRDRGRGAMFRGREHDERWSDRGRSSEEFGNFQGDRFQGRRSFSAHPDDHYRSWRDRHMSELDRDYADYCREREEQFHSDFDSWRRDRRGNPQALRTGMTQSGISHDPTGELQLETEASATAEPDPMSEATLGTSGGRATRRR
jgi:hypothetical protein